MDIENIQEKYAQLWNRAWNLANQIDDDKGGVPIEIRRAMLPELDRMRAELERLEKGGTKSGILKI
ncbi:MAG: hypothetical protein M0T82_05260 [Desulfobacteraceae bacterium]|nr:hypothetical protein [Desulfobacteraceae bacterium]